MLRGQRRVPEQVAHCLGNGQRWTADQTKGYMVSAGGTFQASDDMPQGAVPCEQLLSEPGASDASRIEQGLRLVVLPAGSGHTYWFKEGMLRSLTQLGGQIFAYVAEDAIEGAEEQLPVEEPRRLSNGLAAAYGLAAAACLAMICALLFYLCA